MVVIIPSLVKSVRKRPSVSLDHRYNCYTSSKYDSLLELLLMRNQCSITSTDQHVVVADKHFNQTTHIFTRKLAGKYLNSHKIVTSDVGHSNWQRHVELRHVYYHTMFRKKKTQSINVPTASERLSLYLCIFA